MIIFLFVFIICFAIILFVKNNGLRESIARSYIVLFLLIAISTEVLSFFGALIYGAICLLWFALAVVSLSFLFISFTRSNDLRNFVKNRLKALADIGRNEAIFLLLVASVLSITLVIALIYPPNNWDSMTYHMSRVAEWIQRGSVDFYPTSIDRQNYQPPLAEFAILHLQLLSKSDRFANTIQWYSFFVSIVLVTLIAKEFQLSRLAQLFSAVVASTIPMAVLQSSSTQNDIVTAAFCLGFAYFLLRLVRTLSTQDAVYCALSLGLALFTKGTAYIYCCAIGLTIGGSAVLSTAHPKRLVLFSKLAVVVIAALVLNVGYLSRIYLFYEQPPSNASDITNEEISATVILSNIVKNGALHIGTPFVIVNNYSYRAVRKILGDQLNDPVSTMRSTTFRSPVRNPAFSLHEDHAGNLLHFILIVSVFLILPFVRISHKSAVYIYAASVLFGVLLYCAILRWQPWASRLHTPVFMLAAPLIAAAFAGFQSHYKRLFLYVAVALFAYGTPFLISNDTRPFVALADDSISSTNGRFKSYFINRPELYDDYSAAAKIIMDAGTEKVGLCLGYDDYEYPLWVLVGRHASRGTPKFRHVDVVNISKMQKKQDLPPDLIVATKRLDGNQIHGKGRQVDDPCLDRQYVEIFDSINIRIWKLKGS